MASQIPPRKGTYRRKPSTKRAHVDVMHIVPQSCACAGTLTIVRQTPDREPGTSQWYVMARRSVLQHMPLGVLYTLQCAHRARRVK